MFEEESKLEQEVSVEPAEIQIDVSGEINYFMKEQQTALKKLKDSQRRFGPKRSDLENLLVNASEELLVIVEESRVTGTRKKAYDLCGKIGLNLYDRRLKKHFRAFDKYTDQLKQILERENAKLDCSKPGKEGHRYIAQHRGYVAEATANTIRVNEDLNQRLYRALSEKEEERVELLQESQKSERNLVEEKVVVDEDIETLRKHIEKTKINTQELEIELSSLDAEIETSKWITISSGNCIDMGSDMYYGLRSRRAMVEAYIRGSKDVGSSLVGMVNYFNSGVDVLGSLHRITEHAGRHLTTSLTDLGTKLEGLRPEIEAFEHFGPMEEISEEHQLASNLKNRDLVAKYATYMPPENARRNLA